MSSSRGPSEAAWNALAKKLEGELRRDDTSRTLYATDASVFREVPTAVAYPRSAEDLAALTGFAREEKTPLVVRGAGTSLAGQVVGRGLIVDCSRFLHRVLEVDPVARTARVQPGLVRNDLNFHLAPHRLYFAPETSTQNRATLGGMIGNNACGANSLVYGSTRDHLLKVRAVMSDGSWAEFGANLPDPKSGRAQHAIAALDSVLGDAGNRAEIAKQFPKPEIKRRNTGYALDALAESARYTPGGPAFNPCQLIAGSEGTLCLVAEATVNLVDPPPKFTALVCLHCNSVRDAMLANQIALPLGPRSSELLDEYIFACTKSNAEQSRNRAFVKGDPAALLAVEFGGPDEAFVREQVARCESEFKSAGLGYATVTLWGAAQNAVWDLRKAALGLLANMPGDPKPVAVIEDTAVAPADLVNYIEAVDALLKQYGVSCVHYGHASVGVIHLRPILDLKLGPDRKKFRELGEGVAALVKQYGGALSGEHGDGRLRAEFLPRMLGKRVIDLFGQVKKGWDPDGILNPGKIIDAPPMDADLRYSANQPTRQFKTVYDFSEVGGILRLAEKCNGSGDCRKSSISGGVMCPSYMATRREHDTTRGRANVLREVLTRSTDAAPLASDTIYDVMGLCLSCKGCKTECPSTVDISRMKAEAMQSRHDTHGAPLRDRIFGYHHLLGPLAGKFPWFHNHVLAHPQRGRRLRGWLGIAPDRSLPRFASGKARRELNAFRRSPMSDRARVWLFLDEFTEWHEPEIAVAAASVLSKLGYAPSIPTHSASGRALMSKGFLRAARDLAIENVNALASLVSESSPLVGLEPSAILSFRDEYPDLVPAEMKATAKALAKHVFTLDEFLVREANAGRVKPDQFKATPRQLSVHVHCHQKALGTSKTMAQALALPAGHKVDVIAAGCCGMAGSFGFETEHYELSRQVADLSLIPAVKKLDAATILIAAGTSCRQQVLDFGGRTAVHPAEILLEALER